MITNLYFVRHAHSNYTSDEYGRTLSDKGMSDAKKVARTMENELIDYVVTSPYKRAVQTVEGIICNSKEEIQIVNDFRERTLSSDLVVDFSRAIKTVWNDEEFSFLGGESNRCA